MPRDVDSRDDEEARSEESFEGRSNSSDASDASRRILPSWRPYRGTVSCGLRAYLMAASGWIGQANAGPIGRQSSLTLPTLLAGPARRGFAPLLAPDLEDSSNWTTEERNTGARELQRAATGAIDDRPEETCRCSKSEGKTADSTSPKKLPDVSWIRAFRGRRRGHWSFEVVGNLSRMPPTISAWT
ncbi:hypothetical protein KM043_002811 [Ampulex compressa]|nr:hypothetical protein KM043_002811 [Ampulex compressa]